jgi:hypothetical protein
MSGAIGWIVAGVLVLGAAVMACGVVAAAWCVWRHRDHVNDREVQPSKPWPR